ncbi:MAG: hypothetical protein AB7L28_14770 [Kofleriaceae bacterium]
MAERLALRLGGKLVTGIPHADSATALDVTGLLVRAQPLIAAGSIDDAANILDIALDAAARRPSLVSDPAAFVSGTISRVQIATARGETARAEELIERLLRFSPALKLSVEEDSPRVREVVDRVRDRIGARPKLRIGDLGDDCQGEVDVLIVSRNLGEAQELTRFDHCKLVKTVTVAQVATDEEIELGLLTAREVKLNIPTPEPPPPPPITAPPVARDDVERPSPIYQRPWFWVAAAGLVATSAIVIWQVRGDDEPIEQGVHVIPHF